MARARQKKKEKKAPAWVTCQGICTRSLKKKKKKKKELYVITEMPEIRPPAPARWAVRSDPPRSVGAVCLGRGCTLGRVARPETLPPLRITSLFFFFFLLTKEKFPVTSAAGCSFSNRFDLQVDGRDVPVHLLTNPGGVEWQVNAKLLADLSAGIHHARVRTARSPFCEAGEFRLEG